MCLGGNTLLSFDKACSKLNGPRKRKKKAVQDLGWNVESTRSYFACLATRRGTISSKGEKGVIIGVPTLNRVEREETSSSLGESFSFKSLTDSEVMRCNYRIINFENSEVGRRVWESI